MMLLFSFVRPQETRVCGMLVTEFLETAGASWDATVTLSYKVRECVYKQQSVVADELRADVPRFKLHIDTFRTDFLRNGPFNPDAVSAGARVCACSYLVVMDVPFSLLMRVCACVRVLVSVCALRSVCLCVCCTCV